MTEPNKAVHKEWFALDHCHQKWNQLDGQAREAAAVLGYSAEEWNSGRVSHLFAQNWNELNPPQQDAAKLLGLNAEKWTQVSSNMHKHHPHGVHEEENDAATPDVFPSPFEKAETA